MRFKNGDLVSFVSFAKEGSSGTIYLATVIEEYDADFTIVNTDRSTELVHTESLTLAENAIFIFKVAPETHKLMAEFKEIKYG